MLKDNLGFNGGNGNSQVDPDKSCFIVQRGQRDPITGCRNSNSQLNPAEALKQSALLTS